MADGDGGVPLEKHKGEWFADYVAPSDDYRLFPGKRNACRVKQFHDSLRRARLKSGPSGYKPSDVIGVKTVNVFFRRHGLNDRMLVKMSGKRELNKDAVDRRVVI